MVIYLLGSPYPSLGNPNIIAWECGAALLTQPFGLPSHISTFIFDCERKPQHFYIIPHRSKLSPCQTLIFQQDKSHHFKSDYVAICLLYNFICRFVRFPSTDPFSSHKCFNHLIISFCCRSPALRNHPLCACFLLNLHHHNYHTPHLFTAPFVQFRSLR